MEVRPTRQPPGVSPLVPYRACELRAAQLVRSLANNVPNWVCSWQQEHPSGSSIRLRARARITTNSWTPIHPVWLRCKSLIYLDMTHSLRLARRAPRRPRIGIYFCPDPKLSVMRSCGTWKGRQSATHERGKPTVRQADGGTALRSRKKQMPSCNEADRAWNIAQRENLKHSCFGRSAC